MSLEKAREVFANEPYLISHFNFQGPDKKNWDAEVES